MLASWRLISKGFPRAGGNRQDLAYRIAFMRVFGQRSRQESMKTEWSGFSKALRKDSIGTVLLIAQVHGCLRNERVNVHFYTNCVGTPKSAGSRRSGSAGHRSCSRDTRPVTAWSCTTGPATLPGAGARRRRLDHPEASRLALTHRRADVQALNRLIRTGLREAGPLTEAETVIETAAGERSFAVGDRIVFLENDSRLGVRNGSLGTVNALGDGQMRVRLDGRDDPIEIDTAGFRAFDHGYATTIHKAQGATADRAFVFAGPTMDRHLTYVAMTRHREDVTLHAAKETFRDFGGLAGKLSRSGLQPNALDYEGFLARRGLGQVRDSGAGGYLPEVFRGRPETAAGNGADQQGHGGIAREDRGNGT